MFVLYRYCSEYSYEDIYLGIFRNESEAQEAKTSYINYINENGDPFKTQAYHEVHLEKDVRYGKLNEKDYELDENSSEVYMLFYESEGFGQSFLELKYVAKSLSKIIEVMKTYPKDENFPEAWSYSKVQIGHLYYENDMIFIE
jgi:hypothetical protein